VGGPLVVYAAVGDSGDVIERHTLKILGKLPKALPKSMPWQESVMWQTKRAAWNLAAMTEITAITTPTDMQRIIGKSKLNSAPGLDGVQYEAPKLLLLEDDDIAKIINSEDGAQNNEIHKPFLTFLTNLTNAILSSPTLSSTLGESEVVYLYKENGDPAMLDNYRPLSLQSVITKSPHPK